MMALASIFYLVTLNICLSSTAMVYHVIPTIGCQHARSSCSPGEFCHTLDYYVNNSGQFFSPDKENITLFFMCGVHNQTSNKHTDIYDLQTFAMASATGEKDVTINMPIQGTSLHRSSNVYTFRNVSKVTIEYITINFINAAFEGENCNLSAKYSDFYGSLQPSMSVINISGCRTMVKNCTFQQNVFIRLRLRSELLIHNCAFQSYSHKLYSPICENNSRVIISDVVYFINNKLMGKQSLGAAIHAYRHSSIIFSKGSFVHFRNNTGGVLTAVFHSKILVDHATLQFIDNYAPQGQGGALCLYVSSFLIIRDNAFVVFRNNSVNNIGGGAIYADDSNLSIKNSTLQFVSNFAHRSYGGAIFLLRSSVNIRDYANVSFINNAATNEGGAVLHSSGNLKIETSSVLLFYNNSARHGGALSISTCKPTSIILGRDSVIKFKANSASGKGGALFLHYTHLILDRDWPCFLYIKGTAVTRSKLQFEANTAGSGVGMHIYGGSIRSESCKNAGFNAFQKTFPYCGKRSKNNVRFMPSLSSSLSPVSSDPLRVCLCDINSRPLCTNLSKIFVSEVTLIPGEALNIPMVVVGQDFGVTTGQIYAGFIPLKHNNEPRLHQNQYNQRIGAKCSDVSITVYSQRQHEILYLQTTTKHVEKYGNWKRIQNSISSFNNDKNSCIDSSLLETPVFINITLLECPKGFVFQEKHHGSCNCYSQLLNNKFHCYLRRNKGYLHWNSSIWVGDDNTGRNHSRKSNGILFSLHCPVNYCVLTEKHINLDTDPDTQCAFNRAGTLCGRCKENYTLPIGSSRCMKCSSDRYLALFVFFVAAGLLLVIFIYILDLTVSRGLINGLIFYANIVWAYKNIFIAPLKQQNIITFFQVFIAWLNLDFGVETCFVVGLNAFWKTWLQFLFPLYIWIIAGGIIVACHYSTRLTRLVGDRAVPLLATLFYLSYMKLLRTVVMVFGFIVVFRYPGGSQQIVWILDGNLPYCQHPHIYLFITSIAILFFLCIPFTSLLLLIQCWMRISNLRPLRWINKFTPVYDACFAPLNDNHRHLFGALLLIRGMLLAILTLTSDSKSPQTTNLPLLFLTTAMLLLYVLFSKKVYKSHLVKIFESISLVNLIFLSGLSMYASDIQQKIVFEVSVGFAVVQFCVIILVSFIKSYCKATCNCLRRFRGGYETIDENDNIFHERMQDPVISGGNSMVPVVRNVTTT